MKFDNKRMSQTTIMEIALAAGVSLATVSRVTNHPEKVKRETRERIQKIIKERGYKPNLNAKSLAGNRSTTVAVVVPELTRSSISKMVDGIADCASRRGYLLRIFVRNAYTKQSENDKDSLREFWAIVMSSVVDGVLYINDEITDDEVSIIKNLNLPFVFTNTICDDDEIPSVSIDYRKAAYDMTKEMINRGNKKIWMISTIRKYMVNDLIVEGYSQAMNEEHLFVDVKYVPGTIELNEKIYDDLLDKDHPDVAIVVRDSMAVSFLNVARHKKIEVPEQTQVIGFQNTKYAELSRPQLTCINTPIYDLGEEAMDLLTKLMNCETDEEISELSANRNIEYTIVWRDSTK